MTEQFLMVQTRDDADRIWLFGEGVMIEAEHRERRQDGSMALFGVKFYKGATTNQTIEESRIIDSYNKEHVDRLRTYLDNNVQKYTRMGFLDRIINAAITVFTFGQEGLARSVVNKELLLPPGFYDFGYYIRMDEVIIPAERMENIPDNHIDHIDLVWINRRVPKSELTETQPERV